MKEMFVLAVTVLLLGCMAREEAPATVEGAESAALKSASNTTDATEATSKCKRQLTFCYTGETIMSRDCVDGKEIKWVCEPYYARHNRSIAGIPPQLIYLAEYKCY